ncbi:hypothetical protein FHS21_003098 [Phyllobacterium trifolii]|uniref:Uncharacterized protein n=1 Tax=Phyllobacterium trifolii TaxID=300193 RepID=A0A839UCS5_9HYPH|nr:hypothetical protein [Phyllobacterium trifolii]
MIDRNPTLGHHLLKIAQAQIVSHGDVAPLHIQANTLPGISSSGRDDGEQHLCLWTTIDVKTIQSAYRRTVKNHSCTNAVGHGISEPQRGPAT